MTDFSFSTTKIDEDFINTIIYNDPDIKGIQIFVNPKKYAEIPDLIHWSYELKREELNYIKKWTIWGTDIKISLNISDKVPYEQIRCIVIKDYE